MKKSQKAGKSAKPAQKNTPTMNQIARGECCNASKELQSIIARTGLAPAEILLGLKRKGRAFGAWLESSPELPSSELEGIAIEMPIELPASDWMSLALVARRNGWTLADVVQDVLMDRVVDLRNSANTSR